MKALLTHLTEEILCNALIVSKELDAFDVSSVNPLINQALKYISDNITIPLCIDDIAAQLFITKSHLHHLFVKYLNTTPKKFIISKKQCQEKSCRKMRQLTIFNRGGTWHKYQQR